MTQLLKFEAEWCHSCDQQDEMLEDFSACPIEHIDVDKNTDEANVYNVRSLPTMVLLVNGEPVEQWTGLTDPNEIEKAVEEEKDK